MKRQMKAHDHLDMEARVQAKQESFVWVGKIEMHCNELRTNLRNRRFC